jgi:hypothetical protein
MRSATAAAATTTAAHLPHACRVVWDVIRRYDETARESLRRFCFRRMREGAGRRAPQPRHWRTAGRAPSSKRDLHSSSRMTPVGELALTRARGGQRRLSWKRTGEVRAQELAAAGQGGVAFVEHRGESLEHVRDARCDFEPDGDVGGGGLGGEPGGVVEEDLV